MWYEYTHLFCAKSSLLKFVPVTIRNCSRSFAVDPTSATNMSSLFATLLLAPCLLVSTSAQAPPGITNCKTGAADILGTRKAFTVQVCNLFGETCYLNHPIVDAANCGTEALAIPAGKCQLYPIFEYKDNAVRSGAAAVEHMSTVGDLDCSVSTSSSNGARTFKYSGACVSVQCGADGGVFRGPGMTKTGTSSSRAKAVKDTSVAANWKANTLASLPSGAKQLKSVFLYRTGDYVATTYSTSASGTGYAYSVGKLPTSDGNNYGPVACPSSNNLMTAAKATAITPENLRMCGATGKWVYYNAVNLLVDASHYAKYSGNTGSKTPLTLGAVPFLGGKSAYRSTTAMDDQRAVMLLSGSASSSAVLHTSQTIIPDKSGASAGQTAGCWRNYGVVFYCDDYARTDLTACKAANQKMFYVADPNPNAVFGASAANIGGGSAGGATSTGGATSGTSSTGGATSAATTSGTVATTGSTATSRAMHASGTFIIFVGLLMAFSLQ